jgi:hypothetical protein
MNTVINNNGTFTTRKRTYQTEKGTVTCTMQYASFYRTFRWDFKPNGSSVSYAMLTKKGMKYRPYK